MGSGGGDGGSGRAFPARLGNGYPVTALTSVCRLSAGLFLLAALSPGAAAADDLERGSALYRERCLECHGEQGRGDGPEALRLGFRPRDFTLGAFKCRSTPTGEPPTDEDLLRIVAEGLPGTPMKGHGDELPVSDQRALAAHVKTLSPAFAGPPPTPIELPEPPAKLGGLAAEGKHVYQVLKCWTCHGVSGRGDGPAARTLEDDWGNPIRPFNFVVFRKFKCGGDPRDLYRTLHTGMTGSPMPSYTEAFRFAHEDASQTLAVEGVYDAEESAWLTGWASRQPDRATLESMRESEVEALVERRTWALVAYLRSLVGR